MNPFAATPIVALLSALTAFAAEGARVVPLSFSANGKAGFALMTPEETGVLFTNALARSRSITNSIYLNGSGVAAGDVDGDGRCDLYFCALDGPNRLYRNLGNWKFAEVADAGGAACADLDATGAAFADLDGDGDLDLVVNSVRGGTHIFLNDGKGHFSEAPGSPINAGKGGMSLALADVDGNGTLDLYVANYRTSALMDMGDVRFNFKMVGGRRVIDTVNGRPASDPEFRDRFYVSDTGRIEEAGEADAFFLNDGHAQFTAVSFTGGAFLDERGDPLKAPPLDWGLSAMFHDLNGDGLPDLYVCNDFDSPDRIWMNQGGGKFRELPAAALRVTSMFSMGVDIADVNRDGFDDIFTLDMLSRDHRLRLTSLAGNERDRAGMRPQRMRNTLQLNLGDGTFREIGQFAGVQAAEWAWCPIFLDVDLDGFEDLLITNGNEADGRDADAAEKIRQMRAAKALSFQERMELRRMFRKLDTANVAFRNRGDLTFEDASAAWGFDVRGVSNGMCLADLDNDGDMDVVINNLNGPATLLRNETSASRVAVRLAGRGGNTHGIGVRISVIGGPVKQSQEIVAGGRYLSCDQAQRTFAAGSSMEIEVRWPGGCVSKLSNVPANSLCEIVEPDSALELASVAKTARTVFKEITAPRPLTNVVEVNLPMVVNGMASADFNGDGVADLVAACEWGLIRVFLNERGRLTEKTTALGLDHFIGWWKSVATGDFDGDGKIDIVAGNWGLNSRYRAPERLYFLSATEAIQAHFDSGQGKIVPWNFLEANLRERFPTRAAFAAASIEEILGDRLAAAKVFEANTLESMIFLNRGDHFEAAALPREAQWAPAPEVYVGDFNDDGKPDLYLPQDSTGARGGLILLGDGKGQFRARAPEEKGVRIVIKKL